MSEQIFDVAVVGSGAGGAKLFVEKGSRMNDSNFDEGLESAPNF